MTDLIQLSGNAWPDQIFEHQHVALKNMYLKLNKKIYH